MTDKELDKLKAELGYHTHCGKCRACGECERILELAIKERQEAEGDNATKKPCESCRM